MDLLDIDTIWVPVSVAAEPHTRLRKWRVFRVTANGETTVHFVGETHDEGRVCSPVIEYDKDTKRGRTRSGRIYELQGLCGYSPNGQYVFNYWLRQYKDPVVQDVTVDYN